MQAKSRLTLANPISIFNERWRQDNKRASQTISVVMTLLLVGVCTALFMLRYKPAFQIPNFYAEDGTVIFQNIFHENFVHAVLTRFNGYLISGLYVMGYIALGLNLLLGGHFASLPIEAAFVSCTCLGFAASLPFILFRKELGTLWSLACVLVCCFVPMANFDYGIIGVVAAMKFTFIEIGFMLVLYRILHPQDRRVYWIDTLLLLCVATNVTVALLLPFGLWPYRQKIIKWVKSRDYKAPFHDDYVMSLLTLGILSFLYIAIIYLKGIPKIPGYLNTPYNIQGTIPLIDRSTTFSWLYRITPTMNNWSVTGILSLLLINWWLVAKRQRFVIVFGLASIALATGLFVMNRTGTSAMFLTYNHNGGDDQFFFAQNMIFIFLTFWVYSPVIHKALFLRRLLVYAALGLYLVWAIPVSSSFGRNRVSYQSIGTLSQNLSVSCATSGSEVAVAIYPNSNWHWLVPRTRACKDIK